MSETTHAHDEHHGHHGSEAEKDHLRVGLIAGLVVAILAVVLVLIIGVHQYFGLIAQAEVHKKVLSAKDPDLSMLRAEEDAKLSKYQWVDQKGGVVRVPVQRARQLVLAEYKKPLPPPPAAVSPATPDGGVTK